MAPRPKDVRKLSYTRISTFADKCPRCYAWDVLRPQKWDGTGAQQAGTQVHNALEAVSNFRLDGLELLPAIDKVLKNPPEGPLTKYKLADYLTRATNWLKALTPVVAEKSFKSEEYPHMRGFIDLISSTTPMVKNGEVVDMIDEPCVVDYKTTKSPAYIKSDKEAKTSLQPRIYSLIEGIPRIGYLWFLPSGPVRGTFITLSDKDLRVTKAFLDHTIESIHELWAHAQEKGKSGDPNRQLLVDGYDLSVFPVGAEDRPWINSKSSRHRELCLGVK